VLVVDDQAPARELLSLYLAEAGYGVQWVDRAHDVPPRARALKPVAITLDLLMGDEVAWRVLEQLKADPQTRVIPVVIVSILDEQATGFALGAAAYLVKPVARQDLLDALQRVVRADGRPLHVLAVDDQPEALELIALALEDGPYVLTRASSGEEALRLLAEHRPDVLILDLGMAPVSGFDVITAVAGNADLCAIPIIVLTGCDLTAEDLARLNGHILTALPKRSFSRAHFLREVQRATRDPREGPAPPEGEGGADGVPTPIVSRAIGVGADREERHVRL
jgi:CheY-like chemotaxis protein